jgi:GMP synthase (glutamine-hydrolysing)
LIAKELGGEVKGGGVKEYGRVGIKILDNADLFVGLKKKESAWLSHGDLVAKMPPGFVALASSKHCKNMAIANRENKIYGVQFHPEVVHTPTGNKILENFIYGICGAEKNWIVGEVGKRLVKELKAQVGGEAVIIGVSGGVDSFVAATLLHEAIGNNLYCVFIDNGLLRKNEAESVQQTYRKLGFKHFVFVDARKDFLEALKGVVDPEQKRKIIGETFIRVFERTARGLEKEKRIKFLAQGTIYPDRIETAQPSKSAARIKSHHNVALPEKMSFQIVEPLKEFYKDEVRKLGKELGVPKEFLERHPFPGPGLAIRVVGEVTEERLNILREVDAIFIEELKKNNLYNKIWQAFAALLPVRAVGVMGDQRTYEYIVTLRAVTSVDGMTADWFKMPHKVLEKISNRIINEVRGVNRVLYDISQKPPATIEYE